MWIVIVFHFIHLLYLLTHNMLFSSTLGKSVILCAKGNFIGFFLKQQNLHNVHFRIVETFFDLQNLYSCIFLSLSNVHLRIVDKFRSQGVRYSEEFVFKNNKFKILLFLFYQKNKGNFRYAKQRCTFFNFENIFFHFIKNLYLPSKYIVLIYIYQYYRLHKLFFCILRYHEKEKILTII